MARKYTPLTKKEQAIVQAELREEQARQQTPVHSAYIGQR